jgi:energy-coupling factor transporter transmembrane protein EcfT
MQTQSQREQPKQPSHLLRPQEALAWLTASGLYTLFAVCKIIDKLLRHQFPSPTLFFTPIFLIVALTAWQRIRRGETVTNPLFEVDNISDKFLKLAFRVVLSIMLIGSLAMLLTASHPERFSAWAQFSILCLFGAHLIISTLIVKYWLQRNHLKK